MAVIALIPAAGTGSRMGAGVNKQYLALADRPILAHTISLFQNHPLIDDIFVISPRDEIDYCRTEVVERFGFGKVRAVIEGGAERQDSVRYGLNALVADPSDIVLIHDGVRPFFPHSLIEPLVAAARNGGCVVGVPVKETIKKVADGVIVDTPDRESLWLAQTPQAFPLGIVREAHNRAFDHRIRGTDDAMLVERFGHAVTMVRGSYRNIKITTPEDLVVAQAFLRLEEAR
jgi:2-C-methyl-D-erythritol 4-phosphate cytidylyltransferase